MFFVKCGNNIKILIYLKQNNNYTLYNSHYKKYTKIIKKIYKNYKKKYTIVIIKN